MTTHCPKNYYFCPAGSLALKGRSNGAQCVSGSQDNCDLNYILGDFKRSKCNVLYDGPECTGPPIDMPELEIDPELGPPGMALPAGPSPKPMVPKPEPPGMPRVPSREVVLVDPFDLEPGQPEPGQTRPLVPRQELVPRRDNRIWNIIKFIVYNTFYYLFVGSKQLAYTVVDLTLGIYRVAKTIIIKGGPLVQQVGRGLLQGGLMLGRGLIHGGRGLLQGGLMLGRGLLQGGLMLGQGVYKSGDFSKRTFSWLIRQGDNALEWAYFKVYDNVAIRIDLLDVPQDVIDATEEERNAIDTNPDLIDQDDLKVEDIPSVIEQIRPPLSFPNREAVTDILEQVARSPPSVVEEVEELSEPLSNKDELEDLSLEAIAKRCNIPLELLLSIKTKLEIEAKKPKNSFSKISEFWERSKKRREAIARFNRGLEFEQKHEPSELRPLARYTDSPSDDVFYTPEGSPSDDVFYTPEGSPSDDVFYTPEAAQSTGSVPFKVVGQSNKKQSKNKTKNKTKNKSENKSENKSRNKSKNKSKNKTVKEHERAVREERERRKRESQMYLQRQSRKKQSQHFSVYHSNKSLKRQR